MNHDESCRITGTSPVGGFGIGGSKCLQKLKIETFSSEFGNHDALPIPDPQNRQFLGNSWGLDVLEVEAFQFVARPEEGVLRVQVEGDLLRPRCGPRFAAVKREEKNVVLLINPSRT